MSGPLPTFLVIGAQKAATTTLHAYLRTHPDVFMPALKETNFFIEEGTWGKGLDWYRSLFDPGASATHRGEASPGYTMAPVFAGAPERIRDVVPYAKLVYLVRHPVERMRSAYIQAITDGRETRPMADALVGEPRYLDVSRYAMQLERYLEVFPAEQLLVLRSEDLAAEPGPTLDRILRFLALAPGWLPSDLGSVWNKSATKRVPTRLGRPVDAALRRRRKRRHPLAERVLGRRPLSRPLRDGELDLDADLRRRLEDAVRPDVARLVELVDGLDAWGLLGERPHQASSSS